MASGLLSLISGQIQHITNLLVDAAGLTAARTFTLPDASTTLVGTDATQTLTSKRITKRVSSTADAATITPDCDSYDLIDITAIAQAFTIANPTGTPTNGQELRIRIKDNATARAITWGSNYVEGTGTVLPATTVLSKILNLLFQYNTANSLNKWQLIGVAQESASAAGGGLTNWSESAGTYSSKDWKRFYPISGTNVNAIVSPLGTGSFQLQVADGTSTGGNQRGSRAVDLQTQRTFASSVASGANAFIGSGHGNVVAGADAVCVGGVDNSAGGTAAANGGGRYNTVSGLCASNPGGQYNWAGGDFSASLGGKDGSARNIYGACFFASGQFSTLADAQFGLKVLRKSSTSATPVVLTSDNGSASTTNQIILPNNSCFMIKGMAACIRTDSAGDRAEYEFSVGVYRGANAASTVIDYSNVDIRYESDATFDFTIAADTTNGGVSFSFTGASGKTVRSVVTAWATEVTA